MRGYALAEIIEQGIVLDQFDPETWRYDPAFDLIMVTLGSQIDVYLALACIPFVDTRRGLDWIN